jgi:DNA mismatch repair protein MutL
MDIKILNNWIINKIRAAQVINNYYDLVKELVENSIDAKSKNINIYVNIKNNQVIVTDDGIGMTEKNLKLSIESHATSKFSSLDNINYLGFRGEGLNIVKECGNLIISSKTENEKIGYILQKDNNEFIIKPFCRNTGTEVILSNIFENIPGRINFINKKKDFLNIVLFLQKISLSFSHIRFNLFKDNKHYLLIDGSDYQDLIYQIFKISEFNQLDIIKYINEEKVQIKIYLNSHLKENKGNLLFFVNNRPVEDFGILNILKNILLEKHGHSEIDFLLFFLYIPYTYVDVNITPNKNKVNISIINTIKEMLDEFFTSKYIGKKYCKLQENQIININNLLSWFNYKNKYVVCNFNEEIYFIDIHAISERLLLEKIKNLDYNIQVLLEETTVYLTEEEKILFEENEKNLLDFKFKYELIGHYLLIYEIPDFLENHEVSRLVKELIRNKNTHIFLHKLADFSCKNSLKSGYKINEKEISEFLILINNDDNLHSCCHGRNTFKKFNMKDLDKIFSRQS